MWFGTPPTNADASIPHPYLEELAIVYRNDKNSSIRQQCSAIVVLYPNEATDAIVDYDVANQIQFFIFLCCVFGCYAANEPVITYEDLLCYVMNKHQSIQQTSLSFQGKNQICGLSLESSCIQWFYSVRKYCQ